MELDATPAGPDAGPGDPLPAAAGSRRARALFVPRAAPRIRGVRFGDAARPVRRLEWRGRIRGSRRWILLGELAGFFFLLPISLVVLDRSGMPVPPMPALLVVTLVSWAVLLFDPAFPRRQWAAWNVPAGEARRIVSQFAIGALGLVALTWLLAPEDLFRLPRERTGLWLLVMLLYPLLSVYPQELVWRVFFVHRYRRLLGTDNVTIVVSAATFGFVHLLYGSWVSVGLSTIGGLLFGYTYLKSRSVLLASLEHALYGCFVFTVGLHEYFYSGP